MAMHGDDGGPYRRYEPHRQYFGPGPAPFQQSWYPPAPHQGGGWARGPPMQRGRLGPLPAGPRHGPDVTYGGRHGPPGGRGRGRGGARGGFRGRGRKRSHNAYKQPNLRELEADNRRKAQRHFKEQESPAAAESPSPYRSPGPTLLSVPKAPVNTLSYLAAQVGAPSHSDSDLRSTTPNRFAPGKWWKAYDASACPELREIAKLDRIKARERDKDLAFFGCLSVDEEDPDTYSDLIVPGYGPPPGYGTPDKAQWEGLAGGAGSVAGSVAGDDHACDSDAGDAGDDAPRVVQLEHENAVLQQQVELLNLQVLNLEEKLGLANEELRELRARLQGTADTGDVGDAGDMADARDAGHACDAGDAGHAMGGEVMSGRRSGSGGGDYGAARVWDRGSERAAGDAAAGQAPEEHDSDGL